MLLGRDAILKAPVLTKDVEGVFGGTVRLRAISMQGRMALLDAIHENDQAHEAWKADQAKPEEEREGLKRVDLYDHSLLSVIYAICDEEGQPIFSVEDYPHFADMDYPDIAKCYLTLETLNFRRDPEEVKKNSGSTPQGGSSSGSRSRSVKRSKN